MISIEPAPMLEDKEKWCVFYSFFTFSNSPENFPIVLGGDVYSCCIQNSAVTTAALMSINLLSNHPLSS